MPSVPKSTWLPAIVYFAEPSVRSVSCPEALKTAVALLPDCSWGTPGLAPPANEIAAAKPEPLTSTAGKIAAVPSGLTWSP